MTGERHSRLVELAARAAARASERGAVIQDRYVDINTVITQAERQNEIDTYGHEYDEDCTSPYCTKVRTIYAAALQQALRGGQTNG